MDFETIQLEILERKATLTLNRPNAMNAMDLYNDARTSGLL